MPKKIIPAALLAILMLCCALAWAGPLSNTQAFVSAMPPQLQEDIETARQLGGSDLTLAFNNAHYFHTGPALVELVASDARANIYYTINGAVPTINDEKYVTPFEIPMPKTPTGCVVVKAIAVLDRQTSAVAVHSFFFSSDIGTRFSSLVFSLSTHPDNLYGYENGILVKGKSYDDFVAANPDASDIAIGRSGNYGQRGREWERPVYVEVFSPDGSRVLAQNGGIRVHGGGTRVSPHKSLRLYARKEYEPGMGKFEYNFFPGYTKADGFGTPITAYDQIVLSTAAGDSNDAMMRSQLGYELYTAAGGKDTTPVECAAVFLNGEYYGYAYLQLRQSEHLYENVYDAPERSFDIHDGGHMDLRSDDPDLNAEFQPLIEYAKEGFTDDAVFEKACAVVDMDNLMFYYAYQIYIANVDWAPSNMKVWRYSGDLEKTKNKAKELDGRWRYVLFDLDGTMNKLDQMDAETQMLRNVLVGHNYPDMVSPVLTALMERPEMKERFINYLCDIMSTHCSPESAGAAIAKLDAKCLNEILYSFDHGPASELNTPESMEASRKRLYDFFEHRPQATIDQMREILGVTDLFTITSGEGVMVSTQAGGKGLYFVECRVPVTPVLEKHEVFDYWLVNGQRRDGQELTVSVADSQDSVVHIELVKHAEAPPLVFSSAYDLGKTCGFFITNRGETTQSTRGLYLSDDKDNLKKWPFPALNITPGSRWEFVGKSATDEAALLKIAISFNPRFGEVVFLSNEEGEILDFLPVAQAKTES